MATISFDVSRARFIRPKREGDVGAGERAGARDRSADSAGRTGDEHRKACQRRPAVDCGHRVI